MQQIFLALQVLVAFGLIGIVLIQHGKGADAGAAFGGGGGGGGAGSLFGARGPATLLTRVTAVLALVFFVNSMALAYMAKQRSEETRSVMEQFQPATDAPADAPAPDSDAAPDAGSPDVPAAPGTESSDTGVPAAPGTEDSAAAAPSDVPAAPPADGDTETNTN